ncbi:hypothetical protein ACFU44_14780 [Nocardia rhizosphaerihabitans]|uniref:hypothetical protein n=1 Tax=Nocardia rhizosphaerihabitans TaxID=1691570 RepID=UPI00366EA01F
MALQFRALAVGGRGEHQLESGQIAPVLGDDRQHLDELLRTRLGAQPVVAGGAPQRRLPDGLCGHPEGDPRATVSRATSCGRLRDSGVIRGVMPTLARAPPGG